VNAVSGCGVLVSVAVVFLNISPSVKTCKRLGRTQSDPSTPQPAGDRRQRLLLVTLSSEMQANDVLLNAKLLRDCDNESVRNCVYINKDMTKEEAKAAYEKRVERRAKPQSSQEAKQFGAALSASAAEFVPPIFSSSVHFPALVGPPVIDAFLAIDLSPSATSPIFTSVSNPSSLPDGVMVMGDIGSISPDQATNIIVTPTPIVSAGVDHMTAQPVLPSLQGRPHNGPIVVK
jgi:hypothetical protein